MDRQKIKFDLDNSSVLESLKEIADKIRYLPDVVLPSVPSTSSHEPSKTSNTLTSSSVNTPDLPDSFTTKLSKLGSIATGVCSSIMMVSGAIKSLVTPVYDYSSALEQNTVAFESFLGSTELAKRYMGDLQKIAADTPFDLPGVTDAGKKLLLSVLARSNHLKCSGPLVILLPGSEREQRGLTVSRLPWGKSKPKEKLWVMNSCNSLMWGIPAYTILAEKLGLSAKEVQNIGDAGIDADTAINALLDGMSDKFGGMAEKISNSKQGMMSTIQDNVLAMGEFILRPLDEALKAGMAKVRDWSDGVADAIRIGDAEGAFSAIFPDDLFPPEWKDKIAEIGNDIKNLFDEGKALAGQFGDSGKNALMGIVSAALTLTDGFVNVSRAIIQMGNDLLYIFRKGCEISSP